MNRRAFGRAVALLGGSLGAFVATPARAGTLTQDERDALTRGEVVTRPVDADLEEGTYLGGVSYGIVEAPAPFVLALLRDVSVYKDILALTLEANPAGRKGGDQLVYFKHGGRLGSAGYTMRIREADAENTIRFWMDRTFDHEIDDVWGYVRIDPLGPSTCLATYAILCDLGTVYRVLFGERIRAFALETPGHIRTVAGSLHRETQTLPLP